MTDATEPNDDRMGEEDLPSWMASVTLVLIRRPLDAPEFSEEELERLQAGHLGHLTRFHGEGSIIAAGPFTDQRDERLRGIELWRLPVDEVRRLSEEDPGVQARRLEKEVVRWWFRESDLPIGPA